MAGMLIALEGIDGSGTTTQRQRLGKRLEAEGHTVTLTAEPSTGPVGRLIRKALSGEEPLDDATLALLFAADRLDHVAREIGPARARGSIVVTDRYLLSSVAYQSATLAPDWVLEINRAAPPPDVTLFVRVSAATAASRRASRGGPEERFDADASQRRIAEVYEQALGNASVVGHLIEVDGEASVDEVEKRLWDALLPRLPDGVR